MDIINKAIHAIQKEIEAVRERPSSDVLMNGIREKSSGEWIYEFETQNQGLKFAEDIRAQLQHEEFKIHLVEFKEKNVRLEFPSDKGAVIDEIFLEWENDFVLRKMEEHLHSLEEEKKVNPQLNALLEPSNNFKQTKIKTEAVYDELRNEAQIDAIQKARKNNILFIWGPPGTGKTASLGFVIANLLRDGKKVLFVSNTNRAVDVGLLSVLDALEHVYPQFNKQQITRFGEAALDSPALEEILFEHQVEQKLESRKIEAVKLSNTLASYEKLQDKIDEMMWNGEEVPEKLDLECQLLGEKVDGEGGVYGLQDKIERLMNLNERYELQHKQLIAATLAKVCTSELFLNAQFDAVVVDEGSMASLPYLLIMASKSVGHLVIAGDPMQLPPISITNDKRAKAFLEQDIFTYVSKSTSTEELFNWHDENPGFTCFFDVQYRLQEDLASVISSVFYEGRLKSASQTEKPAANISSVALIDTAKYNPVLEQESGDWGFKPVNEVHQRIIEESIKRLMKKYKPDEIGIIVPFRNSVYKVRQFLREHGVYEIEVGTIHTFQGREKAVIIFDTVMSSEFKNGSRRHYSVRPFDETKNGLSVTRLLNVAFSRSKELLVIIADMHHIEHVYGQKFLGKLLKSVKKISQ